WLVSPSFCPSRCLPQSTSGGELHRLGWEFSGSTEQPQTGDQLTYLWSLPSTTMRRTRRFRIGLRALRRRTQIWCTVLRRSRRLRELSNSTCSESDLQVRVSLLRLLEKPKLHI
uniref:Secreted protein n=1 Tax=Macrostomum lignano TaxID=282301 RepID=A0A1I8H9V3_9PLAT